MKHTQPLTFVAGLIALMLSASGAALAADPGKVSHLSQDAIYDPPYIALGAKLGTLGPGLEATIGVFDWLNVRGNVQFLPIKLNQTINDIDYSAGFKFLSFGALADFHPRGSQFRLSAGALISKNRLELDGTPNSPVHVGDKLYTQEEVGTLTGDLDFRAFAPYLGIGFGNAIGPVTGWNFSFDLGVMFQGAPNVGLTSTGTMAGTPEFEANLKKEAVEIEDETSFLQFYPVLMFGISRQF